MHISTRRIAKLAPAIVLVALALPSSAFGQATRTWVSGVGDDANPCSRTAPCKTFAGAISKTATKGEINCLDPGGFGGVTITKAITIKCHYTEGGVLVSGTNAIVVNAPATDKVTLRGLDINGLGTGLNGIRILSAKVVNVRDSEIYEFTRDGIDFEPSNNPARLVISNVHIHDNTGNGVLSAPAVGGNARTTIRRSEIDDNGCGVAGTEFGPDPAFNFASTCGTNSSASGINTKSVVNVFDSGISDNTGPGMFSRGNSGNQSVFRVGGNHITGNQAAYSSVDAGAILSYGDNATDGNNAASSPTGSAAHS